MYEAIVASRPKVVDGAAPNHVSLRGAHESYFGCDNATYHMTATLHFKTVSKDISAHKSITRSFNQSALNYFLLQCINKR